MPVRTPQLLAVLLLWLASGAGALELQQQKFSDDEVFTAVVETFKKSLMHRFNPSASDERKPLLVLGPALKFRVKVKSQAFVHLTQQELVAQQQAVFLLVHKAYPDPEHSALYVEYDIPSNASFGVLKVSPSDGVLVTEVVDSYRSSSGARATYGQLYQNTACRDNTEMAYRWNFYEGRGNGASGRCLDVTFTEFTDWRTPALQ